VKKPSLARDLAPQGASSAAEPAADLDPRATRRMAALAFLLALLVYVALTPHVASTWPVTGDEPHYLLISHSLLTDGDIRLADNYAERDYAPFFAGAWLDPHVTVKADGGWYPVHEIAFPAALVLPYAVGGRVAVIYALNLIAALVAANTWLLGYQVSRRRGAAWFAWLAVTFTIPMLPYAFGIYTEMLGALLVVWAARKLLQSAALSLGDGVALGLGLVGLSWLVIRFLPLSLALAALLALRTFWRRDVSWRCWLGLAVAAGLTLAGVSYLNGLLYGDAVALGASSGGRGSATLAQLFDPLNHLDSLLGWLLDQRMGLLVLAPVYSGVLVGGWVAWRRQRWTALVLGGLLLLQLVSLGFTRFQVRWGIPPRYLVAVLPLAGGLLALAWAQVRHLAFRAVLLALLALSLGSAGLVVADPQRALHNDFDDSRLVQWYGQRLGLDLSRALPQFRPTIRYKDKGWDDAPYLAGSSEPFPYLFPQFRTLLSPAGRLAEDGAAAAGMASLADPGAPGALLEGPQASLPAGGYTLSYRLKASAEAPPDRALATITVRDGEGVVARREVTSSDLAPLGEYREVTVGWTLAERAQVTCSLEPTGAAVLLADYATLQPGGAWGARWLALAWLGGLLAATLLVAIWWERRRGTEPLPEGPLSPAAISATRVLALLAVLAITGLLARHALALLGPQRYEGEALLTQTGQALADRDASGGEAIVGLTAAHDAGWLAYGPYEPFKEGRYRIRFTLKRGAQATRPLIAWAEITDVPAEVIMGRIEITVDDLPQPEQYEELVLEFSNLKWQKLVFRLYFADAADIWLDRIEFQRLGGLLGDE